MKHTLQRVEQQESLNHIITLSFFFNGRGDAMQRTSVGLFRSLLHQMLVKIRPLVSQFYPIFEKKIESEGEPDIEWVWHETELRKIFESALREALKTYTIWIFVDALDECGEEAAIDLVDYFQELSAALHPIESSLRTCFSCRHYPSIALENAVSVEESNHEDIVTYVKEKLQSKLLDDKDGLTLIQREIIDKASGIFHWVVLVVPRVRRLIKDKNPFKLIWETLQKIPPGLNGLYMEILDSISDDYRPRSLKLMQWICLANRSLSLDELRFAMAFDVDRHPSICDCQEASDYIVSNNHMEQQVVALSRGLAEVKNHGDELVAQFIHQSVNDYLIQDGLKRLDSVSTDCAVGIGHYRLARSCINYLKTEEIQHWGIEEDRGYNISVRPNLSYQKSHSEIWKEHKRKFPLLPYAVGSWFLHAEKAEEQKVAQTDLVEYFHWPDSRVLESWLRGYDVFNPWTLNFGNHTTLVHVAAQFGLLSLLTTLLERGAEPDFKDTIGRTPLSRAAENGHYAVVKLLLGLTGFDPNFTDFSKRTPLSRAAANGHQAIVKLLVDFMNDKMDADNRSILAALGTAASNGHETVVKLLLNVEGLDLNLNSVLNPCLRGAANHGNATVVAQLLEKGAEPDSKAKDGDTPLLLAAVQGHETVVKLLLDKGIEPDFMANWDSLSSAVTNKHQTIVKLLLDRGVNSESKARFCSATMLKAASKGEANVVKLLLEQGVNLSFKDSRGQTSLSLAASHGHEAVVGLLLERCPEPDRDVDKFGRTPLLWATLHGHDKIVKLLLDRQAQSCSQSDNGQLLSAAASNGHETTVKLLLERGMQTEFKNNKGQTSLSVAASEGCAAVVQMLLLTEAFEPDSKDYAGRTPLSHAAAHGSKEVIKLLLEQNVELDFKDSEGRTPLAYAAEQGHEDVVKLLVEKGADLDSMDSKNQSPLIWAATYSRSPVAKLLLRKGAKLPNQADHKGQLLIWAAYDGEESVVMSLLGAGSVDLNFENRFGWTPLFTAAMNGHGRLVELLLENGADSGFRDRRGQTSLSQAVMDGHDDVVKLLLSVNGIEADSRDDKGYSPLSWAAYYLRENLVKQLLNVEGVDPDSKNNKGQTPLSLALTKRVFFTGTTDDAVVKHLLERGADPNSRDSKGWTPLSYAVQCGHEGAIKKLLRHGADPNLKDNSGQTPLSMAESKHQGYIKKLLEEHNAKLHSDNISSTKDK